MSKQQDGFSDTNEEEGFFTNALELIQRKPVVTIGLTGLIGSVSYGYWRYKTKGFLVSPSLFLMQLRVGAQSVVVGVIVIGMLHNMITKQQKKKNDH